MSDDKSTHEGAARAVDKAQDAVGAVVGKTSATLGGSTTSGFVKNAALGDMYEIRASEIALKRATSPAVRKLAEQMIGDHQKALAELRSTLISLPDVEHPPEQLDERRKGMIDNLEAAPEDEFDRSYLEQQYAAHDEATTLFRKYSENGDVAALKQFATKTLPVLEKHFSHVQELRQSG